jgi:selenocysteine lyase/cysteine desulfurase
LPFINEHSRPKTRQYSKAEWQSKRPIIKQLLLDEYAAIFTPNASGAARLVGESYPFQRGSRLVLTFNNHNSINGMRKFARQYGAKTVYMPAKFPDLCIKTAAIASVLKRRCSLVPAICTKGN